MQHPVRIEESSFGSVCVAPIEGINTPLAQMRLKMDPKQFQHLLSMASAAHGGLDSLPWSLTGLGPKNDETGVLQRFGLMIDGMLTETVLTLKSDGTWYADAEVTVL